MSVTCTACRAEIEEGLAHRVPGGGALCPSCLRAKQGQRICAVCGTLVARRDCHRNRYGEYICKVCGAAGVLHSKKAPVLRKVKTVLSRVRIVALYLLLGLVALKLVLVVVDRMDASAPAVSSGP